MPAHLALIGEVKGKYCCTSNVLHRCCGRVQSYTATVPFRPLSVSLYFYIFIVLACFTLMAPLPVNTSTGGEDDHAATKYGIAFGKRES